MDNKQLRLEIIRMISNPLPIADNYYKWISKADESSPKKSKITRKNLTDNKE